LRSFTRWCLRSTKSDSSDCEPIINIIWPITTTARSSTSTFRSTSRKPLSISTKNSAATSSPETPSKWVSTSSADSMMPSDPTTPRESCCRSISTISSLPVPSDSARGSGRPALKLRVSSLRCSPARGPRLQCQGADPLQRAPSAAPV